MLTINGILRHSNTLEALANLSIEACEKTSGSELYIGTAYTDIDGRFSIYSDPSYQYTEGKTAVFFKIYDAGNLVQETKEQLLSEIKDGLVELELFIDYQPMYGPTPYPTNPTYPNDYPTSGTSMESQEVTGTVLLDNGRPAEQLEVKVFQKSLHYENFMSSGYTDNKGHYQAYLTAMSGQHLIVRVYTPGKENPLAESELICNAKQREVVNLTVPISEYSGPTLFESIEQAVLMYTDEKSVRDYDAKHIQLLSCDSGIAEDLLLRYQKALQWSEHYLLSSTAFFALLSSDSSLTEEQIDGISTDRLKHALALGWDEFTIPKSRETDLLNELAELDKQNIQKLLQQSLYTSPASLQDIWSLKVEKTAQLEEIGKALQDTKGNAEAFWTAVQASSAKDLIPELELLTSLNNLTLGNHSLIKELLLKTENNQLEDLAGWTVDAWTSTLASHPIPSEIKEQTGDHLLNYATAMKRMVDYLYPNKNMVVSLGSDHALPADLKADFATFFANNPQFDFGRDDVQTFLENNSKALLNIADEANFTAELNRTMRQYRLSPKEDTHQHLSALRHLKMDKAEQIVDRGYALFKADMIAAGGNEAGANFSYATAQHLLAMVNNLTLNYQYDVNVSAYVINNGIKQDPTWQNLFGSEDYCGCQHCKSVYSPAAYLADSLHFLENRMVNDTSVYQELDKRRPDLKHILLNCANANTPMPYIDLVNEVLELAVAQGAENDLLPTYQTTRTAAALRASPEHIENDVYIDLKAVQYPWSMPFDLYNRLGKVYLKHLRVEHHKLVRLFPTAIPDGFTQEDQEAKAILSLNETDRELLLGEGYANQEAVLWGIRNSEEIEQTSQLDFLMQKSQLQLDEVKLLVSSRFVNSDTQLSLLFPDPCSTAGATLHNLNVGHRKRIIQLNRLQQKLGVDLRTTDQLLAALDATTIDRTVLQQMAQLKGWHENFGIAYPELATWVGLMPTAYRQDKAHHQELYERLFLSQTEQHEDDEAAVRSRFELRADRAGLQVVDSSIGGESEEAKANRNYILGALGLSAQDLNAMLEVMPSNELSLENLSTLYGYRSMAKAFKLSIADLVALVQIVNAEAERKIDCTKMLIDFIQQIQTSNLSISQVLFLFDYRSEDTIPTEEKTAILQELQDELWPFILPARVEHFDEEEAQAALIAAQALIFEKLSISFDLDRGYILRLLSVVNDRSYLEYTDNNDTKPYLSFFLDDNFRNTDLLVNPEQFPALYALLDLLQKINLLVTTSNWTNAHVDSLISETGKNNWIDLNALANPAELFADFKTLLQVNEAIENTDASAINIFDLLSSEEEDMVLWNEQLSRLFNFEDVASISSLLALEPARFSHPETYLHIASAIALENHLGIRLADYANANENESGFGWAITELDQKRVSEIIQVAKAKYGEMQWQQVTQQLRDRIREEQRDALLTYIMNHLVNEHGQLLDSPEKVYTHFLIDTEMSACAMTSRIKLALSSVQLFVQRCLMNLEPNLRMDAMSDTEKLEWQEWTWRKNYRVWEANRKVFLYPENWLEPEWRDDKTPFFKELETELQQNELNNAHVEKAYLSYLTKLDAVSNLEIVAICEAEKVDNRLTGYYIFGRTHGSPKFLHFRKWSLDPQSFSAWEKIDFEFEGDHLLPAMHKGRLHLFWPIFAKKSNKPIKNREGNFAEPDTFWHVQLAWTQFYNGSWAPKKLVDKGMHDEIFKFYELFNDKDKIFLAYMNNKVYLYRETVNFAEGADAKYRRYNFSFDFSLTPPVAGEDGEESFIDRSKIMFGSTFMELNQQQLNSDENNNKPLLVNGFRLINNKTNYTRIASLLDENAVLNLPIIIKEREVSVLIYSRNPISPKSFTVIPLQRSLYPRFVDGISTYGFGSNTVTANWLDYQSESFQVAHSGGGRSDGLINFNLLTVQNTNEVTSPTNLHESPAFSQYVWELYFHIPMYIANKLKRDQRFEEAQRWFHYVFNPTAADGPDGPQKFWFFQPFRDFSCLDEEGVPCNIRELMLMLNEEHDQRLFQRFERNVHAWEQNPFSPHTAARGRIIAYMKWVVMRYIDNLIEWADQLFRRDSIESLNEATQLYMLAWNILGEEAQPMNERSPSDKSYDELREDLDEFSNARVHLEDRLAILLASTQNEKAPVHEALQNPLVAQHDLQFNLQNSTEDAEPETNPFTSATHTGNSGYLPPDVGIYRDFEVKKPFVIPNLGQQITAREMLYFCIPQNEQFFGYWGLVRDRFFKLRNCLNIDGVSRQLSLFEPPIDPALLVKARAAGMSIADALSAQYDAQSHYRFLPLLQKAIDYANDVRGFGGALLAAMEKRDAEKISLLRSQHESQLLDARTLIRKEQINELKASNEAMAITRSNIEKRINYYAQKEYMSGKEVAQMTMAATSQVIKTISHVSSVGAAVAAVGPDATAGASGLGAHLTFTTGSSHLARSADNMAKAFAGIAGFLDLGANMLGQLASYDRRKEEWEFQESTAEIELQRMEKQILAAEIRMELAKQELKSHESQVENSKEQLDFVRTKFTNGELYDWMVGELKTLYFQSYQMAFDMAKKAEQALEYEFGIGGADTPEPFIQFGYWNNAKEGLLSGDKLHHDLKRMEMVYMQRNKRKHEVSQTFSLGLLNPAELLRLREDGLCEISIDAVFFDLAYPNQTNRKVKAISLTIPAVTGPYTGVQATLSHASGSRISTSSGQNDFGLFQFTFNDERYLPFEGINPATTWQLSMNNHFRAFDYNTISDVLLHIHYTADDAPMPQNIEPMGEETPLEAASRIRAESISNRLNDNGLKRYFSLKNEFADVWFQARVAAENAVGEDAPEDLSLNLVLENNHFPFYTQSKSRSIQLIERHDLTAANGETGTVIFNRAEGLPDPNPLHEPQDGPVEIHLNNIQHINNLDDIVLVVTYRIES